VKVTTFLLKNNEFRKRSTCFFTEIAKLATIIANNYVFMSYVYKTKKMREVVTNVMYAATFATVFKSLFSFCTILPHSPEVLRYILTNGHNIIFIIGSYSQRVFLSLYYL